MTQEDKQLLLKDFCARLPYGVKVMKQYKSQTRTLLSIDMANLRVHFLENDVNSPFGFSIENPLKFYQQVKPYLRPMSSMTGEEFKEYHSMLIDIDKSGLMIQKLITKIVDWLDEKMFDHRGLIPKRLALEATKGMYKTE